MQKLMLPLLLLFLACGETPVKTEDSDRSSGKPNTEEWEDLNEGYFNNAGYFASPDGRFMVDFPGKPEHSSDLIDTHVGDLRSHTYIYSPSATEAYMVFYADYPSDYVRSIDASEMLQSALTGALRPLGVTGTESAEEFMINGMPAIEFRSQGTSLHMVGRILLDGNRLFQVTIIKDGNYPSEETIEKFLGSFYVGEY